MTKRQAHLKNRRGNYYFRYAIPTSIQHRFSCNEFTYSLKTRDYHEAKAKVGMLLAAAEIIMNTVKQGRLTPEQAREIAQQYFRQCLERLEQQLEAAEARSVEIIERMKERATRVKPPSKYPSLDVLEDARDFEYPKEPEQGFPLAEGLNYLSPPLMDTTLESGAVYRWGKVTDDKNKVPKTLLGIIHGIGEQTRGNETIDYDAIYKYCLHKYGLQDMQPETYSYKTFKDVIDKAIEELRNIHQQKLDHVPDADLKYKYDWLRNIANAPPTLHGSKPPVVITAPLVSTLYEKYLTEQDVTKLTADQKQRFFNLWLDIIGDSSTEAFTPENMMRFKDTLKAMPKHFKQKYKGKKITDIDLTAVSKGERLHKDTINNHLIEMRCFVQWCKPHGYFKGDNPFEKTTLKKKRGNREKPVVSFNGEQLKALFSSPVYTGCESSTTHGLYKQGNKIIWHEMYWVPLIALYTGAREQEICQLLVTEIRKTAHGWLFDFNDKGEDKHIKNDSSVRETPVHSELIRLGILDFVEKMKKKGNKLFPDITVSKATGKAGSTFSKRFKTYRDKFGVTGRGFNFHSFRHTLTGALRHAGVSESIGEDITGHAPSSIHGNYGERHRLAILSEALEKVKYPISINPKKII